MTETIEGPHRVSWFNDWCLYCNTKHGDAAGLKQHVLSEHPDSARAKRYHEERAVSLLGLDPRGNNAAS